MAPNKKILGTPLQCLLESTDKFKANNGKYRISYQRSRDVVHVIKQWDHEMSWWGYSQIWTDYSTTTIQKRIYDTLCVHAKFRMIGPIRTIYRLMSKVLRPITEYTSADDSAVKRIQRCLSVSRSADWHKLDAIIFSSCGLKKLTSYTNRLWRLYNDNDNFVKKSHSVCASGPATPLVYYILGVQ